jgi:hypothetical protein
MPLMARDADYGILHLITGQASRTMFRSQESFSSLNKFLFAEFFRSAQLPVRKRIGGVCSDHDCRRN